MDESEPDALRLSLVDPARVSSAVDEEVPDTAVLGGWRDEVASGDFHVNPDYEPNRPDSATDPVDAVLQLAIQGDVGGDVVLSTVCAATLSLALDDEGHAVVALGPEDIPTVLVATAPAHRERVAAEDWLEISAAELADGLPDEGVDVLLNPGAPSSMRVMAEALRKAMSDALGSTADSGPLSTDFSTPRDPLDAVLRRLSVGDAELDELRPLLLDGWFDVALRDGHPLMRREDSPCLLLTTAESHRPRVDAQDWQRADLTEVATMLPDGVDVVLNPGDDASLRLSGEFIRETVLLGYGAAVG